MINPTATNPMSAGAGAGLWIRVSANLSRRKVTWRLTNACLSQFPVPPGAPRSLMQKAAMGFLQELWGNIAEHTVDGVIAHLPDAQLEQWAGWDGEPGMFAAWLRASHLDPETGRVNEWEEFAGALQTKRAQDARRSKERRDREKAAREALDVARADVVPIKKPEPERPAAVPVRTPSAPYRVALSADEIHEIARDCTIAANKGMGENAKLAGEFNPIHAGRGDSYEFVTFLAGEGIEDWDLIKRIVYTIAKTFEPQRRGDHIKSLTFFRERTIAMWMRDRARADAEKAGFIKEVPVSRGKTGSGANTESRSARSAAGALAAATAVGLADD